MAGHHYSAWVEWACDGDYAANQYSRGHIWRFDGGLEIPASASPTVVPLPHSIEAAVDPEEAFVAAISSCHMLWFLDLARRANFNIASYRDHAYGEMNRVARGKMAITKVVLRPEVSLIASEQPDPTWFTDLHEKAHDMCFIANSVNSEIVIEPEPLKLIAP
ncbi:OsmC family peroxiredoxin [Roseibium denhamense]|uniref:Organic hydroperoxide reductase OsmC/OhrA n=1 Tax=Roseibium denhamense TaxID=76305 RepID=A0ABY1P425_9HYPH|nr:OsmC family protein [Roseibium denhamense]MTI07740.1 OsmC family peroxiredoxin [Roseibium denhamense]SMP25024.1 Organic hydroperoxide reductase OsmC/OhrA [Roseibium denhamense]